MTLVQRGVSAGVWLIKLGIRYLLLLFGLWGVGAAAWTGTALWAVAALPLAVYVAAIVIRSYRGVDTTAEPAAE